jgi:hypothetical protein
MPVRILIVDDEPNILATLLRSRGCEVSTLRKKVEFDLSNPRYIMTEPWLGYRFADDGAE